MMTSASEAVLSAFILVCVGGPATMFVLLFGRVLIEKWQERGGYIDVE